ncbi:hypothetical protein ACQ4M3_33350 [Leptolyngbya sp. AN03gr2]
MKNLLNTLTVTARSCWQQLALLKVNQGLGQNHLCLQVIAF